MQFKTIIIASLLFTAGIATANASDVRVGVSVAGEVSPGVYGRVDIGNTPPPLVYAQPVVIVRQPRPVALAPLYMNVPPGHAKNWGKHCHKYNACARPVYFVRTAEYGGDYGHGKHGGKHRDDDHGHGDRDHGHGHGHGHGRDH
jgi:hypothetical protein